MTDDEKYVERRKDGWTLWKEVYGTFIGILPFLLLVLGWGIAMQQEQSLHTLRLTNLEKADVKHDQDQQLIRTEINNRLERISTQIENLQKDVSRAQH